MATSAWLHVPTNMRLTECLESVLKEQRPHCLPALLANYREHGVVPTQGSSGVAGLVGCSNAKLSTSKTKFDGLCMLSVLVKDSSTEVFQQHCLSWLRSLQQVIQAPAPGPTARLAVGVLADLLQYSSMLPELAREVGLTWLLGLLTSLLGLQAECELTALEGIAACMTHYPRACGSLRDKLAAFFLARITSSDPATQEMACRCYGRLPCLGGALERGVGTSRAEAWANQLHCLLASANSTLAQIYQGAEAEGTVSYEGPGVELSFPALDEADPLLLLELQHRYRAACLALQHTLSVDPQCAVVVPVRQLLNLVCRALSVGPKSLGVRGDDSMRLLVLPAVHSNTLTVLSALITAVRGGMVQYAGVLQKVFSQTISAWTPASETSGGQQKAFSSVRVALYSTLGLWVQVGGASASLLQGSPTHSELLFSHLLGDVSPGAEGVKLRAGAGSLGELASLGGRPGPRRSKAQPAAPEGTPSLQRKSDPLANQDACLMALKVLRRIIMTSGSLLKEEIHKRLHDLVIPLCVRLQQQLSSRCTGASEAAGGSSGQYASAQTRRELYRLLLALVLVPSARWPAPLSCTVSILSHGRRDRSLKVASFCGEALTVCNGLLHPRAPTLSRPLRAPPGPAPLQPQGPASGLPLPAMLSPAFPPRHPLGPSALLGSLENHLSLGLPDHGPPGPEGPPEVLRPVFVRYDREEAEDVEISLASDSDDSVVIVPPGMLGAESPPGLLAPPPPLDGAAPAPAAPEGGPPPADLASSLLAASDGAALNSFPPSAVALMAPAPPPGPGAAGEGLPGGAQLQQMLMLPPGPPGAAGHQLAPQNRHLHGPAHPLGPGPKDSAVININSSDEEEEEEEEEEDELGEEEEEDEDGMEEEEEGSDFQDEEPYDEEYDDYEDEEAEELEEEQDGDMPPLEGKVEEEEGAETSGVEGEMGGIEEVQTNRAAFGAERGERLQEVESIGVMEEARETREALEAREALEEEGGDPTMPQILCVTGGSLEEQEVGPPEEEPARAAPEEEEQWRPAPEEVSPPPGEEPAGGEAGPPGPPSMEGPGVCAEPAPGQPEAPPPGSPPSSTLAPSGPPQEGDGAANLQTTGAEDESPEDVKGLKRKREEEDLQGADKRKVEEGGVASMLADFIACPPDEEEGGSSSSLPCLD